MHALARGVAMGGLSLGRFMMGRPRGEAWSISEHTSMIESNSV